MEPERGWVKLYRRLADHPIWKRPAAAMVFLWLIQKAKPRRDIGPKDLGVGQVRTSLREIEAAHAFTYKQVRAAVEWLEGEGMIEMRELPDRSGSLAIVVNFRRFQGEVDDAFSLPMDRDGDHRAPAREGQTKGQTKGHTGRGKKGTPNTSGKRLRDKGKGDGEKQGGADHGHGIGHTEGQSKGHALYKVKEVSMEETNPPYPPFSKGGAKDSPSSKNSELLVGSDDDRVRLVLAEWAAACEAAGVGSFRERRADAGARRFAERLGGAELSIAQLREGMRRLLAAKADPKTAGKYRMWDLKTLSEKPSEFVPGRVVEKKKSRRVMWYFICDVCKKGLTMSADPHESAPAPQPCINTSIGCQGTMRAEPHEVGQ